MKKEELLEIGLTEEQASKVFALNGLDIEREKTKTTQAKADLADAQQKLADRDKDLESLKSTAGDAEAYKKQLRLIFWRAARCARRNLAPDVCVLWRIEYGL